MKAALLALAWIAGWAFCLLALGADADVYLTARNGSTFWSDTSNSDPLETGTEAGVMASLAVGDELGLSDVGLPKSDFAMDAEVEAGGNFERLHGRNDGSDHHSADGADFQVGTLGMNLWPGWQITREWTVYAGMGGGVGLAHGLGGLDCAPWWQIGGGLRWNMTPQLSFDLGARALWLLPVHVGGYRATYDAVPEFYSGTRWEFK